MPGFSDLHEYVALPRLTELRLSPDGRWLAAVVQHLSSDRKKYVSSIWRIAAQPTGPDVPGGKGGHEIPPVRLTRSAEGEASPEFLPDGCLLFLSRRSEPDPADPDEDDDDQAKAALWLLPADGGEAARIAAPPGGVTRLAVARQAGRYLIAAPALAGTAGPDEDAMRRKARADAGVTAILHEGWPARYWDHDLGPDAPRLLAGQAGPVPADSPQPAGPRDLTPEPGRALDEQSFELSPDGSAAVTGWTVAEPDGEPRSEVAVIDVATGRRRTLLAASGADFSSPRISPDGVLVLAVRSGHDTYSRPGEVTLVVAALDGSDRAAPRDLLAGLDRRPAEAAWAADSRSVYFTADDRGRRPVYRAELGSGEVGRLTADDAGYEQLCPAPDGTGLYALRNSMTEPPAPVWIALPAPDSPAVPVTPVTPAVPVAPVALASPAAAVEVLEVPGRLAEVKATASDGAALRGWLVLPPGACAAAPAPLLLWVHGGPVASWNGWSWRWNPHLMAARGYAVLLPDPALSTGYGHDFIARGHAGWGDAPFTDLMAITDEVTARPDIDSGRTAMMGGSYGGYMANWIAGHTDRFRAIVSHASLWALDQLCGTTDGPASLRRTFGDPLRQPERYLAGSPHLHADRIVTPMLIIHGKNDYRVPVTEALRLYWDLTGRGRTARFLYFPDENHWVLRPGEIRLWYETVFAFLAEHVLGEPWQRPDLL
jgi:dipeptidyl aminopeptidase/acylaminoacyl peptidase